MSQEAKKLRNLQIKKKEDLFRYLPREIETDILSRLPIWSIIMCKIVCKSWRELVENIEFANSHLSKAVPRLAVVFQGKMFEFANSHLSKAVPRLAVVFQGKMFEFVDEQYHSAHRCKNIISNLSFPHRGVAIGSINGLLFWCIGDEQSHDFFVCNPITREYKKLPPPPPPVFKYRVFKAGVGVSKMSRQCKIVRILRVDEQHFRLPQDCECQVLTLGTGSWRSFSAGTHFRHSVFSLGAYLNGNLHWLACGSTRISCFDLETELFTSFSSPRVFGGSYGKTLSVVGDRLCLCDSGSFCYTDMWFMNEYGDEKSWTKEYVIREENACAPVLNGLLFPIKVFINGDVLIAKKYKSEVFYYSKTTDVIHETGIHKREPSTSSFWLTGAVIFTPTFLPLRTLLMETENVTSF